MRRFSVLIGMVILGLALLVSTGDSQDTKKKPKGMLPAGFKDLGLSKAQIEKIYGVQAEYKAKIVELDKKKKELVRQESAEVFKVLTDEQREKYLKSKGVEPKKDGDKKTDKK